MMKKVFFKEVQKARQPWVWLVLIPIVTGTIILFGSGINQQIIQGVPFGDSPMSDTGLIIVSIFSCLLMVGISILFFKMRLETKITSKGVSFRYPPFIRKWNLVSKESIKKYEVRKYKPIKEYGGWGLRTSSKKNGKAYNMSGNIGLQLYLTDYTKILFGTLRKTKVERAMKKMMNE